MLMSVQKLNGSKTAILDIDEVLLDMLSPMHLMYEQFIGQNITNDEFFWHMRNFNKEPERYKDFGVFFNSSPAYLNLPPKKDMLPILTSLKAAGFDIHLVSASSDNKELQKKRKENVCRYYGDIFTSVNCIGSQNKQQVIRNLAENYDVSFYCDDTPQVVNQSVGITDYSIWLYNSLYEVYAPLLDKKATQIAYNPRDILKIVDVDTGNAKTISAKDIQLISSLQKING